MTLKAAATSDLLDFFHLFSLYGTAKQTKTPTTLKNVRLVNTGRFSAMQNHSISNLKVGVMEGVKKLRCHQSSLRIVFYYVMTKNKNVYSKKTR